MGGEVRVLLVESRPSEVLELEKRLLAGGRRFVVRIALSAAEAIESLAHERWHCVVLDQRQNNGGPDLLRAVRQHDPNVPVVLLAQGDPGELMRRTAQYGRVRIVDSEELEHDEQSLARAMDEMLGLSPAAANGSRGEAGARDEEPDLRPPWSSERVLERLLPCLNGCQLVVDSDGRVLSVAGNVQGVLGRADAEVLGRRIADCVPPESAAVLGEARRATSPGEPRATPRALAVRPGVDGMVWVRALKTMDPARPTQYIVQLVTAAVLREQDALWQAEGQEWLRNEKLVALQQLAAGLAHELNNPLTSVVGFSELLLLEEQLDEDVNEQIRLIVDQARRASQIIQKLTMFSSHAVLHRDFHGLNGIIVRTLELFEIELRSKHVRVELDLDPQLPFTMVDFQQVQHAFGVIIGNAIQSMYDRNGGGRLLIRSVAQNGRIIIAFRDDGPGIRPEVLPQIFDPFFTTREIGHGEGLGLSMAFGIVRNHGGRIVVENNTDGPGASFNVELPIEGSEIPRSEVEPDSAPRILLVEDEEPIIRLIKRAFRKMACRIDIATNGELALERLSETDYDAIICDFKMPRMNGDVVYRITKQRSPELAERFIFVSGDTVSQETLEFIQETGTPYLYKPFSVDSVRRAVSGILARRRKSLDPVPPQ